MAKTDATDDAEAQSGGTAERGDTVQGRQDLRQRQRQGEDEILRRPVAGEVWVIAQISPAGRFLLVGDFACDRGSNSPRYLRQHRIAARRPHIHSPCCGRLLTGAGRDQLQAYRRQGCAQDVIAKGDGLGRAGEFRDKRPRLARSRKEFRNSPR